MTEKANFTPVELTVMHVKLLKGAHKDVGVFKVRTEYKKITSEMKPEEKAALDAALNDDKQLKEVLKEAMLPSTERGRT
jgi:hypothetical protein